MPLTLNAFFFSGKNIVMLTPVTEEITGGTNSRESASFL